MLNIYEIIESLGLEQAKEDKLQTYLIKNQKEREELYSALISRKTNESKLSLLESFFDNMSGMLSNNFIKYLPLLLSVTLRQYLFFVDNLTQLDEHQGKPLRR